MSSNNYKTHFSFIYFFFSSADITLPTPTFVICEMITYYTEWLLFWNEVMWNFFLLQYVADSLKIPAFINALKPHSVKSPIPTLFLPWTKLKMPYLFPLWILVFRPGLSLWIRLLDFSSVFCSSECLEFGSASIPDYVFACHLSVCLLSSI